MDDDKKAIRKIKQTIKNVKFKFDYRDLNVISEIEGNEIIRERIIKGTPLMVARGGATEMRVISEYLRSGKFSVKTSNEINMLSGFFPSNQKNLQKFCEVYIKAISEADILSLWGVGAEAKVVHKYCGNSILTQLHALEPYYFEDSWSAALEGKKILVIHPFTDSICKQYQNREYIFPGTQVLPQFSTLKCIKAVQSIVGQKTEFESWFEALEYMKKEIAIQDFDVAIIGAGAYGLPLAAYCKEIGKQAIQMSGATQILFGIKGKRWDTHPIISKFYNESWIRPANHEIPEHQHKVEGGSYW